MSEYRLRAATASDRPFVEDVFFTTQRWILDALFGSRDHELERSQFAAEFDEPRSSIVVAGGSEAGWLTVWDFPEHRYVHSLYLAPGYQRRGLGSAIVCDLVAAARADQRVIRMSTASINPARQLYGRLGFRELFSSCFKTYLQHDIGRAAAPTSIRFADEVDGVRSFIVVHNGMPVGDLRWWSRAAGVAVLDLALEPEFRGRGIGPAALRILVWALQDDAWRTIEAVPATANADAIGAFANAGFRATDEQPDPRAVRMLFDDRGRQ